MVDAPFRSSGITVTQINLGIDKVEVVGASGPAAFATFGSPQVVNILSYTSVAAPLSFSGTIPAGSYTQVRLLLDTATTTISYVDAQNVTHTNVPLTVPSATAGGFGNATSTDAGDGAGTAGVKVNVPLDAVAGQTYGFVIDFNAMHSIVQTGNGNFLLKPVLVATSVQTSGTLTGTVKNQAGAAVTGAEVDAVQNGSTVNSGVTDANGAFTINALPAGTYSLVVKNQYTTLAAASVTATAFDAAVGATLNVPGTVTVTAGQTTSVPAIID